MSKSKNIEKKCKITWKDIHQLVQNYREYYKKTETQTDAPLKLMETIFSIYNEHMKKQEDKNIDLSLNKNRPEILRSNIIRKYRGKEPDYDLRQDFKTDKGVINRKLREFIHKKNPRTNQSINPKCLVLASATAYGAEAANFFICIEPPVLKTKRLSVTHNIEQVKPAEGVLQYNLARWKASNYSGEKALKPPDLIAVESFINTSAFDDECLAYFFISCLFRRYNYQKWWNILKERPLVVSHVFNLLLQSYQRPFWRAAFILQYANPSLLQKCISEKQNLILSDRVKPTIEAIASKNVEGYLSENMDKELYAEELLKEFSIYKKELEV